MIVVYLNFVYWYVTMFSDMTDFLHLYVTVCYAACSVANCEDCGSSLSQCSKCSAGYYLTSSTLCSG